MQTGGPTKYFVAGLLAAALIVAGCWYIQMPTAEVVQRIQPPPPPPDVVGESNDSEADTDYMVAGKMAQAGQTYEALSWYRKAADLGSAKAQFFLGNAYDKGAAVTQDAAEALKWYAMAAVQHNADAQAALGGFYAAGRGVRRNAAEAAEWYRRAAQQGQAEGFHGLGHAYLAGAGVKRDYAEAYFWLALAAPTSPAAMRERDAAAGHLSPDQLDKSRSLVKEWKPKPESPSSPSP